MTRVIRLQEIDCRHKKLYNYLYLAFFSAEACRVSGVLKWQAIITQMERISKVGMMKTVAEDHQTQIFCQQISKLSDLGDPPYIGVGEPAGLPVPVPVGGCREPHGEGRQEGEDPAGQDPQLGLPPACGGVVVQRELDSHQAVQVDKNKIVDGTTESHHHQTCHDLTEQFSKIPSKQSIILSS